MAPILANKTQQPGELAPQLTLQVLRGEARKFSEAESNHQNRRGIEAITGSASFDISEWMLLQFSKWLPPQTGILAILCKDSVARKVFYQIKQKNNQAFSADIYLIDAKLHFHVSVNACLFVFRHESSGDGKCHLYPSLNAQMPSGFNGQFSLLR